MVESLAGADALSGFHHIDIRGFTTSIDPQFLIEHAGPQGPDGTQHLGDSTIIRDGFWRSDSPVANAGAKSRPRNSECVGLRSGRDIRHDAARPRPIWERSLQPGTKPTWLTWISRLFRTAKRLTAVGRFGGGFQGTNGGGSFTHNPLGVRQLVL